MIDKYKYVTPMALEGVIMGLAERFSNIDSVEELHVLIQVDQFLQTWSQEIQQRERLSWLNY